MLRYDVDFNDTVALLDHTTHPERGTVEEAYGALNQCGNCGEVEGPVQNITAFVQGAQVPMTVCLGCARFIEEGALEDA